MFAFKSLTVLLLAALLLPGCGGGEDADETLYAQDAEFGDTEPPSRGPEWLLPPPEPLVLVAE